MNNFSSLHIQQMLTKIMETESITEQNINILKQFSSLLLSNKSSDPNLIEISNEYQGMILILCKLAILAPTYIPNPAFFFIFRLINASILHFYSNNMDLLTAFIEEISHDFAVSYLNSIKEHFIGEEIDNTITNISIASLLLFAYFSNPKSLNPFFMIISELPREFIIELEKCVKYQSPMILLRAAIIGHKEKLENDSFEWIPNLINEINPDRRIESELRLDILLLVMEITSVKIDQAFISKIISFAKTKPTESITALQFLSQVSKTATGVTADDGDNIISIIKELISVPKLLKYPLIFIENSIHDQKRALENLGLLYSLIRGFNREFAMSIVDASNDDSITKMVSNISGASRYFGNALQAEFESYCETEELLKKAIEGSFPPLLNIELKEVIYVMRPVRYLRVAILQMIPQIM